MKLKYCSVCGKDHNLEFHHFIPKSDGGTDEETNLSTLCYQCHGIVHGMFRRNIRELTISGLEKAKARGVKLGNPNPKAASEKGMIKIKDIANQFAETTKKDIEQILLDKNIKNLREMAKELELRNIKTSRGKLIWHQSQVSNLLKTLKIDYTHIKRLRRNHSH
jgi:hypothetical protein